MATVNQEWLDELRRACVEGESADAIELGDGIADLEALGQLLEDPPELEDEADTDEFAEELGLRRILNDEAPATVDESFRDEARATSLLSSQRRQPLRHNLPPETSELKKKQAKFAELESQLTERELLFTNLQTELSAIKSRYLKSVGARYAELDEIQAQAAELDARSRPLDCEAQRAAKKARKQAERSRAAVENQAAPACSTPSPVLKRLYREVAKRIHPDLGAGPVDRALRARLMAEANRAYVRQDETRLRAIVEDYECSPETVSGEDTASELVRVIRRTARVRRRLTELDRNLLQARQSELFQLKVKLDEKAEQGSDLLAEMAARVEERIAKARQKLADLIEDVGEL